MRKMFHVTVLVLFGLAPAFAAEPTTGPLAGMTAAHNQARQNLNAGNPPVAGVTTPQPVPVPALTDMAWDDTVAASAQSWADQCIWSHPGGHGYGENLAAAGPPGANTGGSRVDAWTFEAQNYDYANNSKINPALDIGHYTQVVWASSLKVGCGHKLCGAATGVGQELGGVDADYWVCRYEGAGNNGNRPYCSATQTTGCEQLPVTITVNKSGTGTGLVESNWQDAGGMGLIHCGSRCTWSFQPGSLPNIQLTATPDPGSSFTGWTGDCAHAGMSATCDLGTVTTDKNVTAGFSSGPVQRTLTVTKSGSGSGTVTSAPMGIDCGGTCSFAFDDGTPVTLTAAASTGSAFGGWGGDCAASGTSATCPLTMNAAKNVTAMFIDPCAAPIELVCGNPENGTTSGATNDFQNYNVSCTTLPHSGPDVLYQLVPPEAGSVTVDLTNLAADYDLFVLGACDPNNCTGGSEAGGTAAEQVTFTATAGTTYRVVVEDFSSTAGTFTLSATCPCSAPNGVNHTATSSTVNGAETLHVCSILTITGTSSVGAAGHWQLYGGHSVVFEDGLEVLGQLTVGHSP